MGRAPGPGPHGIWHEPLQNCPSVGLTHELGWIGLGCVGLGRHFSAFRGFGWVQYSKSTKI